jgi:hypothetical protein
VLIRRFEGREKVAVIMAASPKLRHGAYTAEFRLDDRNTFPRWKGNIEGRKIESFGVVTNNDQGLVVDYTIAFRPLPAIQIFRDVIYPWVKDILGPEYWEYSETPRSAGFHAQLAGGIVPCRLFSSRDAKSE